MKTDVIEPITPHLSASQIFKNAYENRYTWDSSFKGYKGCCIYKKDDLVVKSGFIINKDSKFEITYLDDDQFHKLISEQLFEITIHRVKRTFEETHGKNKFSKGLNLDIGLEIHVTGRSKGDMYLVKDNIITMVNRNIHGYLIRISTIKTKQTNQGYLSKIYSSEYINPVNGKKVRAKSFYKDSFIKLPSSEIWVLSNRVISDSVDFQQNSYFEFEELQELN